MRRGVWVSNTVHASIICASASNREYDMSCRKLLLTCAMLNAAMHTQALVASCMHADMSMGGSQPPSVSMGGSRHHLCIWEVSAPSVLHMCLAFAAIRMPNVLENRYYPVNQSEWRIGEISDQSADASARTWPQLKYPTLPVPTTDSLGIRKWE